MKCLWAIDDSFSLFLKQNSVFLVAFLPAPLAMVCGNRSFPLLEKALDDSSN
jgi:hypothetical protein